MSYSLLDGLADAAPWAAFEGDGVTPSALLSLVIDPAIHRFGRDAGSGRIEGGPGALDHHLRRSLGNLDLTSHDELRLWVRADRLADGTPERPFFLEARLGSALLPIGDPQNTWHRFLPVPRANAWDLVSLALDDLPADVRGAVSRLELRCVDDTVPFALLIDDLAAVREEMVADAEAALVAELDGRLIFGGNPVPAHVENVGLAPPPLPYVRIELVEILPGSDRPRAGEVRRDYAGSGYRVAGAANDFDLVYDIDAATDSRQHTTRILELVLARLAPRTQLAAAGRPVLVDWRPIERSNLVDELNDNRPRLRFRVATRQVVGPPTPVVPTFNQVSIATEPAGSPM